jgi:hypothetical protein
MNQEIQVGKYEFYPNEFSDEREKLLIELELLSLSEKERETKLRIIRKKLAKFTDSNNTTDSLFLH